MLFRAKRKTNAEKVAGEERDLLGRLEEQVTSARTNLQERHEDWETYRSYCEPGGQIESLKLAIAEDDEELECEAVETNLIFATRESQVATLVASMQSPVVVDAGGEQSDDAQAASAYLRAWGDWYNLLEELGLAFGDAWELGAGFVKVYWDTREDDVLMRAVDPVAVYPDPAARRWEDCSFVAIRHVYGEDLAKELFPHFDPTKASKVALGSDSEDISSQQLSEEGLTDPGDQYEVWEHYHGFAKQLTIYSGEQVLFDGDNPTPNGRCPLFPFLTHRKSYALWGESIIPYLIGNQDLVNKTRTRVAVHQRNTGNNAYWTDDPGLENLKLGMNEVNQLQLGTKLGAVPVNPLPPEVNETMYMAQAAMDTISGSQEATRGIRPKGVTSGIGMEVLVQQAQNRFSRPARNWTYVLRDAYQCALEIMQESYAEERSLPVRSWGVAGMVRLSGENLQETVGTGEYENDDYGEPFEASELRARKFIVAMEPDGTLPNSPIEKAELSVRLWEIMPEYHSPEFAALVFNATRLPGREKLIAAMQRDAAQRMQGREDGAELAAQMQEGQQVQAAPMSPALPAPVA